MVLANVTERSEKFTKSDTTSMEAREGHEGLREVRKGCRKRNDRQGVSRGRGGRQRRKLVNVLGGGGQRAREGVRGGGGWGR